MDDAIADHYSRPHQSGGFYKQMGVKHGQPVPLHKTIKEPYLERSSGRDANTFEKGYAKIASQARQAQQVKGNTATAIVRMMVRARGILTGRRRRRPRNYQNINVIELMTLWETIHINDAASVIT